MTRLLEMDSPASMTRLEPHGFSLDGILVEKQLMTISAGHVDIWADGKRVAIGATGNDDNGDGAGHVRIYDWNGTDWVKAGQEDINGEGASDESSHALSMSTNGNRVAIGAKDNDGISRNGGHIRIYDWNPTSTDWDQLREDIDGLQDDKQIDFSVAMSADGS